MPPSHGAPMSEFSALSWVWSEIEAVCPADACPSHTPPRAHICEHRLARTPPCAPMCEHFQQPHCPTRMQRACLVDRGHAQHTCEELGGDLHAAVGHDLVQQADVLHILRCQLHWGGGGGGIGGVHGLRAVPRGVFWL